MAESVATPAPVSAWRERLWLLAALYAAILAGFHATVADMVHIWWTSSTFNHCFLIVPIAIYLGMHQRSALRGAQPAVSLWGVAFVLLNSLVWLGGELMGVAFFQHLAVVGLVIGCSWALLGDHVFRILLFPFLYLYFAVPEGEFLVPYLQDWTAKVLVESLRLTGIPVFIEGRYLSIPTGNFVVAEACSGINYLIATLAIGAMFMYLNFKSLWRRILFMLFAIAVPLIANGLRAYGIVMIAHLSDYRYALGVDHFIYGWVFFGVVIFALFAVGGRFSDIDTVTTSPPRATPWSARRGLHPAVAVALVLICAFAPRGVLALHDSARPPAPPITLPPVPGWTGPETVAPALGASYPGADAIMAGRYSDAAGHAVEVEIIYFRAEREGMELIQQTNVLFDEQRWMQLAHARRTLETVGAVSDVDERQLRELATGNEYLLWSWYDTSGRRSARRLTVKLAQALARLRGDHAGGALVAIRTRHKYDSGGRAILTAFLHGNALQLERMYAPD